MIRVFSLLICAMVCGSAYAQTPHRFMVDDESCVLRTHFKTDKGIPGKKYGTSGFMSGCTVTIDRKEYEEKFSFCYLSGVRSYGTDGGYCEVAYYKKHDAYLFEISPLGGKFSCSFSCMPNTSK